MGRAVELPQWAACVFELAKPVPALGVENPDPDQLAAWQKVRERFIDHWGDIDAENWPVPENHEAYLGHLRQQGYAHHPADGVRRFILEAALKCSWDVVDGRLPHKVREEAAELDRLNRRIEDLAADLAQTFRQRDALKAAGRVDDLGDEPWLLDDRDPFDFYESLARVLHDYRASYEKQIHADLLAAGLQMVEAASSAPSYFWRFDWPDLLERVFITTPRCAQPTEIGDRAVLGLSTKFTIGAAWGRRMLARLSNPIGGYPEGFVLGCLTYKQLAALTLTACDIDDREGSVISPKQMQDLVHSNGYKRMNHGPGIRRMNKGSNSGS